MKKLNHLFSFQSNKCYALFTLFLLIISFSKASNLSELKLWNDYRLLLNSIVEERQFKSQYGLFTHNAVNYEKLNDSKDLKILISKQMKKLKAQKNISTSDPKTMAFWIDAYNFYTIAIISKHYPIKSMRKIGWKSKECYVGDYVFSLDQIEKKILLPMKHGALVHFAVNCASVGCPSLNKIPYSDRKDIISFLKKNTRESLKKSI